MDGALVHKSGSARGSRGILHWEALKSRSSESARDAYFYIYADKGMLNFAVKYPIGSGSVAISDRGGLANNLIAPLLRKNQQV